MRRSLVCLLATICALQLFASCGDNITHTWNLSKIKTEEVPGGKPKFISGPLYMTWEAEQGTALGFLQAKGIPGMVMPMGGGMLAKTVKDITFRKDGNIVVTYALPGADPKSQEEPTWQKSEPGFVTYKIVDNQLRLFPNMEKLIPLVPQDSLSANLDLNSALSIMTNGIPVNYTIKDNTANLYIDKAFIEKITPLILAFSENMDNSAMGNMGGFIKGMLKALPAALQKTTKLEIGLNLEK